MQKCVKVWKTVGLDLWYDKIGKKGRKRVCRVDLGTLDSDPVTQEIAVWMNPSACQ